MTPTLDKMQTAFKEKMNELQANLDKLKINISEAGFHLLANPGHKPTLSRYNLLCHNRSETLTKIRKLKERITRKP